MATIMKRCDCPRDKWARCMHSWTVRWWGTDGKQHEKSFKRNYSLASEHARRAEAAKLSVHRGDPAPPPEAVSLRAYAQAWLEGLTAPPGTVRAYSSALRNHVLPQHGQRPLAEVAADREGMQALLRSASPGVARVVLIALRAMLTEAKAAGRITGDRLGGLRTEPPRPVDFRFPSYSQIRTLAGEMGVSPRPSGSCAGAGCARPRCWPCAARGSPAGGANQRAAAGLRRARPAEGAQAWRVPRRAGARIRPRRGAGPRRWLPVPRLRVNAAAAVPPGGRGSRADGIPGA